MELTDELTDIRNRLSYLFAKRPHCKTSIGEAMDALEDAIDEQHKFEGTGDYAPTDADLKYMGQELKMEGERE